MSKQSRNGGDEVEGRNVEVRIERLKRAIASSRSSAIAAIGLALLSILWQFWTSQGNTLKAQRIELRGPEGRTVARLYSSSTGGTALEFLDSGGGVGVSLRYSEGSIASLEFRGPTGVSQLGLSSDLVTSGTVMFLRDSNGMERIELSVPPVGESVVVARDGPFLGLFDADGQLSWATSLGPREDGKGIQE